MKQPVFTPPLLCEITFVQRVYCVLFHDELKMGKKLCLFSVKSISRKNNLNVDFLSFLGKTVHLSKNYTFFQILSPLCMLTDWCKAKACFVSFVGEKCEKCANFLRNTDYYINMLHRQLKCYVDTSSSGEFDLIYNTTYLCRYKKKHTIL